MITTFHLTCPSCRSSFREEMPEGRCVVRFTCPGCGEELRPELQVAGACRAEVAQQTPGACSGGHGREP